MTRSTVLGVTVGVGFPFNQLAPLAASCFSHYTGIPALVLADEVFTSSQVFHPAALRLKLFDIVTADRIVYFDADWFCIAPWTPPLDSDALYACRDFILTNEWPEQFYDFESSAFTEPPSPFDVQSYHQSLRLDYISTVQQFADIHLPCSSWINSGLLILNRTNHQSLFNTAYELYTGRVGHHNAYYEQPALVKAIELTGTNVELLARKLNVLAAFERKWPHAVQGLHIKPRRHPVFLEKIQKGFINTPQDIRNYFIQE